MRTSHEVALWPRQNVDKKTDRPGKGHQNHPEHRAVHAPALGITANPNQQSNVECDYCNENEYEEAGYSQTTGTTRGARRIVIGTKNNICEWQRVSKQPYRDGHDLSPQDLQCTDCNSEPFNNWNTGEKVDPETRNTWRETNKMQDQMQWGIKSS
jgi:hypothetical protein